MRALLSFAVVLLVPLPALAADPLDDTTISGRDRYERCLTLVDQDPGGAYSAATAWRDTGGAGAAGHCQALALVALKRYREAAAKLDQLGRDPAIATNAERAELLDQAGNAWLLAGVPASADASFTVALSYAAGDRDILFDRARARGARQDWAGAEKDLSTVLSGDPQRVDVLVLRASARHAQGRKAEARADVDQALSLYHDYPDALLERGEMKAEAGDSTGALADWQRVLAVQPGGEAARAAKAHIADLQAPPKPAPAKRK